MAKSDKLISEKYERPETKVMEMTIEGMLCTSDVISNVSIGNFDDGGTYDVVLWEH